MGVLSWLGWLTVGALGVKDAIETSQMNDEARERAIAFFSCAEATIVSVALSQDRNDGTWTLWYRVRK